MPLRSDALGDPALLKTLNDFVRRRVPPSDVDDVVQTVLCDALAALASPTHPRDPAELKRWLLGIAKHKVADRHRHALREPPAELPEIETGPAPIETREMVRWAEEQAGETRDAKKILDWMAREGEGEKLEAIAADERLPAARVRQRVSRMRRVLKERWAAELAAVAMLAALAVLAWWLLRDRTEPPVAHDLPEVAPTITPEPLNDLARARNLRADALRACENREWRTCLYGLDQARGLDPTGDQDPAVGAARAAAEQNLRPTTPEPTSAVPFSKAPPGPKDSKESAPPAPSGTTAPPQQTAAPVQTASPKPVSKPSPSFDEAMKLKMQSGGTPGGTGTPSGTGGGAKKPSGGKKRAPKEE